MKKIYLISLGEDLMYKVDEVIVLRDNLEVVKGHGEVYLLGPNKAQKDFIHKDVVGTVMNSKKLGDYVFTDNKHQGIEALGKKLMVKVEAQLDGVQATLKQMISLGELRYK